MATNGKSLQAIRIAKFFVLAVLFLTGFSHIAAVEAASICCKCSPVTDSGQAACLTGTADSCSALAGSVPRLAGLITCEEASLGAPGQGSCRPTSEGGSCPKAPVAIAGYTVPGTSSAKGDTKPITPPKIGTQGLDVQFATDITDEGGYASIPFLAQFISSIYRYAVGAGLIAAALMIVYGGFQYILGGTFHSIASGQEKIKDALFGLILLVTTYALLNAVNPDTAQLKPLTVKIAKYDDNWLNSIQGDPSKDYPPIDFDEVKKLASNAAAKTAGSVAGSAAAAAIGSTEESPAAVPAAATPAPIPAGDIVWEVDSQGRKLWPKSGCSGLQLIGKNNAPGSFTAIFAALSKPARTREELGAKVKAVVEASKTGTIYARGIEGNKEIRPYTDPPEELAQKDKYGRPKKRKVSDNWHLWWILQEIYNVKKWRTEKMISPDACGPDLPPSGGKGMTKFAEYFSKGKGKLVPCMNAVLEVYNNTYLKVAQCFDIKTDQCSFAQNLKPSGVKIKHITGITRDELAAGFGGGAYPPGTNVSSEGGTGHQWVFVGGLGLGYEVLEWGGTGGDAYNAPKIIVQPGFFGAESTALDSFGGLKTSKSVTAYINTQRYPSFQVYVPEW